MIHPARQHDFHTLAAMIAEAVESGLVTSATDGDLTLHCYSRSAVYDRLWTPAALMCRGLILDYSEKRVVSSPWPKFFNYLEGEQTIPNLGFETFEKVDGSLIQIFWDRGIWRAATKGSFRSDQAKWAADVLAATDLSCLVKGGTYLAEAVGPQNRIVVYYPKDELVLLGAYDEAGYEYTFDELSEIGWQLNWRVAHRHPYASISELLVKAEKLPASEEGFVLRFANGLRLKIKGDEYKRIHALVSRITPLGIWEAMAAGDDLNKVRRDLPEEFWGDFDAISSVLGRRVTDIEKRVAQEAATVFHLSDKEVGLRLNQFPENVRRFIFPWRNNGGDLLNGRTRQMLFRGLRPTGNVLPGYTPSYAMNRVMEDTVG